MNELNKLFGRDFLIGFFLPAALFLIATSLICSEIGEPIPWLKFNADEPLKEGASLAMIAFGLGVLLQAINRELFRMLEGYWPLWLREPLSRCEKRYFVKLQDRFKALRAEENELKSRFSDLPPAKVSELIEVAGKLASRFPAEIENVLPTSFGNTARSYEIYPLKMYGFEAIGGWARIQTVISKPAVDLLSQARSRVNLWLNLFYLALVVACENVFLIRHWKTQDLLLFVTPVALGFAVISYFRARSSLERYGDQVKATYDVYLGDLCKKLGFQLARNPKKNREFWEAFSRASSYRQPDRLTEMANVGLKTCTTKITEEASSEEKDED